MPASPMLSDYAADKAIDALCGNATWTLEAAFHLKMHLGDPGPLGTANPATETGLSNDVTFTSGTPATNTNAITIATVSTTETYTHWSAWNGATGPGTDDCLCFGPFTEAVSIIAGETLQIDIGDFELSQE